MLSKFDHWKLKRMLSKEIKVKPKNIILESKKETKEHHTDIFGETPAIIKIQSLYEAHNNKYVSIVYAVDAQKSEQVLEITNITFIKAIHHT